jgi:mannitol-1-phosphate/altronate dehydrogenase
VQDFFFGVWQDYASPADARTLVSKVLANASLWGQDLNAVPGVTDAAASYLTVILDKGVAAALRAIA